MSEIKLENGTILHYVAQGEGKPLLLLHGNGETHEIFNAAIAPLSKQYTCYAIDSRGHGLSSICTKYDYREMADDIRLFIEALDLRNIALCGFSDGGIIALLVAMGNPRIRTAIACGANIRPDGLVPWLRQMFWLMAKCKPSPLLDLMMHQPDITHEELKTIACPTLICVGQHDLIKLSHTKEIADNIPHCQMRVLPAESHGSYIVGSTKIAGIVAGYLSRME